VKLEADGVAGNVREAEGALPPEAVLIGTIPGRLDPTGAVYIGEVMLALGAIGVAEADRVMLEATAVDEGELEAEAALELPSPPVVPSPAHRNARELNSTRARHSPSRCPDPLSTLLSAGPNPSLLHPAP